jgi:uncharacterized protein
MDSTRQRVWARVVWLCLAALTVWWTYLRDGGEVVQQAVVLDGATYRTALLCAHEHRILAYLADTPKRRMQGLSHTQHLEEGTGMLFVFDEAGRHGMWMKDMHYALDILWLDEGMRVVHTEERVSPQAFPQVLENPPSALARFVLELPENTADMLDISEGDVLSVCEE